MDLSHPERLLVLLLAPLLWWLARPPRPRLAFLTAHLAAWRRAFERVRRRPVRFRKLRFWMLFLALLAVGAAAAGPRAGVAEGPRELVVLLDATASTGAREPGGGTALDRARERLRGVLAEVAPAVTVRVLVVGGRLETIAGEPSAIAARLERVEPHGSPTADTIALAERLADPERAVWTLTDGRGALPGEGALTVLGGAALPNAGIVGVRVVDAWPLPEVRVQLEVIGTETIDVRVEGGAERDGDVTRVASGASPPRLEVPLRRTTGGPVELALATTGDDALSADDRVTVVLAPPPAPDVAVLRPDDGGRWIGRAAEALAELGGGRVVEAVASGDEVGFVLADGGRIDAPVDRTLSFGTAFGAAPDWRSGGAPLDWDRAHPLTAELDLSELRVGAVLAPGALPRTGRPLIVGPEGPWLVAVEDGGRRAVHAAFRLDDANLPLLPAFPQLLRRAFAWCYGAGPDSAVAAGALPGPAESDLRRTGVVAERPLPVLADDGIPLTVPLLAIAFLLLAARLYA